MSHWTDRIFKNYKSDSKPVALTHEPESAKGDFEVAALIADRALPLAHARQRAARAIGLLGDRGGIPALIGALRDSDASVRKAAADALASFTLTDEEQRAVRQADG